MREHSTTPMRETEITAVLDNVPAIVVARSITVITPLSWYRQIIDHVWQDYFMRHQLSHKVVGKRLQTDAQF
jgi:hypothetical protein